MLRNYRSSTFRGFLSGFASVIDLEGNSSRSNYFRILHSTDNGFIYFYVDPVETAWKLVGDDLRVSMDDFRTKYLPEDSSNGPDPITPNQTSLFADDFPSENLVESNS